MRTEDVFPSLGGRTWAEYGRELRAQARMEGKLRAMRLNLLLCVVGCHDKFSHAEDYAYTPPPEGHLCHPSSSDSRTVVRSRFVEWTSLRCRRCAWRYP